MAEKKKKEKLTFEQLKKKYSSEIEKNYDVISSGSIAVDLATGIGGFPRGRIVETFGPESSGKSTIAQMTCGEALLKGLKVAYLDSEYALDPSYAKTLGFDIEHPNCLFSQPDGLEDALNQASDLIESGEFAMVVIDSLSSLVPTKEVDGAIGDNTIGVKARYIGQFLRKVKGQVAKNNVLLYTVGQLRDKIGVMYGSPETTDYGNSMKFFASMRIRIARTVSTDKTESETRVDFKKNKCAKPFTKTSFQLEHGVGINKQLELFEIAKELGVIDVKGRTHSYDEVVLGTSKDSAYETFAINFEMMDKIEKEVYEKILSLRSTESEESDMSELQDEDIPTQSE